MSCRSPFSTIRVHERTLPAPPLNRCFRFVTIFLLALLPFACLPYLDARPAARPLPTALADSPRAAQWNAVDEAVQKGLPKTALQHLDAILSATAASPAAAPEYTRALILRIVLADSIEGSRSGYRIRALHAALASAPAAARPLLQVVQAHWYLGYLRQHRWQIQQRTRLTQSASVDAPATAPAASTSSGPASLPSSTAAPDFETWDIVRLLTEIDRHFSAALADTATLQATPIATFDGLLGPGTMPDACRPTLYDFLAYEALAFYQTSEFAFALAEEAFEIDATGPVFDDVPAFLAWRPPPPTDNAVADPKYRAIRLLQDLLRFHQTDADRSAFLEADLARLAFAKNAATGDAVQERHLAALRRFADANAAHEASALALARLASELNRSGDPTGAHALARLGRDRFPQSPGGIRCANQMRSIEARESRLATESVWNAPWPTLDVTYRNVDRIHFRAVPADFAEHLSKSRWDPAYINRDLLAALLTARPALAWSHALPPTPDFRLRTERIPAPESLKPGYYVLLASHDPDFGTDDNQVSACPVWIGDLVLITRIREDSLGNSGLVLRASTGDPVPGALVRLWRQNAQGVFEETGTSRTDSDGRFSFSTRERAVLLLASHDGHAVGSSPLQRSWVPEPTHRTEFTTFFTDRALYRPGQSIRYKGVTLTRDPAADHQGVLADVERIVVLEDANGREVARASHRTNDYGSFSGVFTAPRGGVTGRLTLRMLTGEGGASVSVEEYKRPKFRVEIDAPAAAAALGTAVSVTGRATAYTGAPLDGARVKWRVQRAARLPSWCWWWPQNPPKPVAHGTAVTGPDGSFQIRFTAEPDRSVPPKNEPVFSFAIHADVTDTTGETRSSDRTLQAGYTALQASLSIEEWQTSGQPVRVTVSTASLDDTPQPAAGTLTVHALRQPQAEARGRQPLGHPWLRRQITTPNAQSSEPDYDPANPDTWPDAAQVFEAPFTTDAAGTASLAAPLPAGAYRVSLATRDRFGTAVAARRTVLVLDPDAARFGVHMPSKSVLRQSSVEPGDTFTAFWGTGYDYGRAYIELECGGRVLGRRWTSPARTQELIALPVDASLRGGFTLRITQVRDNRAYVTERVIEVPWSDKRLTLRWERFRSKLTPGQKETWTAVLTGPDAKPASAEMVAALYDASLDQFLPHHWPQTIGSFRVEYPKMPASFHGGNRYFQMLSNWRQPEPLPENQIYRTLPSMVFAEASRDIVTLSAFAVASENDRTFGVARSMKARGNDIAEVAPPGALLIPKGASIMTDKPLSVAMPGVEEIPEANRPPPDLNAVVARRALDETAFFLPHLLAGADGSVRMEFTVPEALTEWRFLGFAHDAHLRSGFLTDRVVTSKDLMVQPNPPRFLREGDSIEFTVKVSNRSDRAQSGTVRLTFADADSLQSADAALGNRAADQPFELPAGLSRSFSWRIAVPDGQGFLTYKAVAATPQFSDGEEGFLPILSRRTLVTESLPLPIRGGGATQFSFDKLLASGSSGSLRHQSLTVQMVSNPAWYAVMALPYLMEYPHECSEQIFNRLYANALARHIAASDPKIRRVFEQWRDTPALDSPLEKNQELKSVMIEETPWLRQARSESRARRDVGLLFDGARLDAEEARAALALSERQLSDGRWPWFPGGAASDNISLYIVAGFGRLRHLGVAVDAAPAVRAIPALDAWIADAHRKRIQNKITPDYVPSCTEALYLYARSFFLEDRPVAAQHRESVDFLLERARAAWVRVDGRQSQAHLALALRRFGDAGTPDAIVRSLRERSVVDPELGMHWRDRDGGWSWHRAPIETQALMIEAFSEIAADARAVEDCKVWLLRQKQTQAWASTKATADAIYALLLRGRALLASDALTEVSLAGQPVRPETVEAGTGFYEKRFAGGAIRPEQGRIVVTRPGADEGVSWGAVHWQYLEDTARITPQANTPLSLKKTLFVAENTPGGRALRPVSGPLSVGDELVVRLELRTDRDLEFVHLKDQRGSGTEPASVLSGYRYQGGFAAYESTRDTASHIFIDRLPKGVHILEYVARVQLRGRYQTGIAEIQCLYAPEYNAHSESFLLEVR